MCLFLFVGSVLPVSSQSVGMDRLIYCNNGDCETVVIEGGGGWSQYIQCGGSDGDIHVFHGSGSYGGSVCGITMQ